MTVYEALQGLGKEKLAKVMADMASKIARRLVKDEYGEELEVSNFTLGEIERDISSWLSREAKEQ